MAAAVATVVPRGTAFVVLALHIASWRAEVCFWPSPTSRNLRLASAVERSADAVCFVARSVSLSRADVGPLSCWAGGTSPRRLWFHLEPTDQFAAHPASNSTAFPNDRRSGK